MSARLDAVKAQRAAAVAALAAHDASPAARAVVARYDAARARFTIAQDELTAACNARDRPRRPLLDALRATLPPGVVECEDGTCEELAEVPPGFSVEAWWCPAHCPTPRGAK